MAMAVPSKRLAEGWKVTSVKYVEKATRMIEKDVANPFRMLSVYFITAEASRPPKP